MCVCVFQEASLLSAVDAIRRQLQAHARFHDHAGREAGSGGDNHDADFDIVALLDGYLRVMRLAAEKPPLFEVMHDRLRQQDDDGDGGNPLGRCSLDSCACMRINTRDRLAEGEEQASASRTRCWRARYTARWCMRSTAATG